MTTIRFTTVIEAPVEVCFQLALSIDLELEAAKAQGLRAVGGVTSGTIGAGERVLWKTRQFGIPVSHVSEITAFERPGFFQDKMIAGIFESFEHDHFFKALAPKRTEMRDVVRFSMPLLLLGMVSERLILSHRLADLLRLRNTLIKKTADACNAG